MAENVWNPINGKHVCAIDNSMALCIATGKTIATVKNGTLYALDGQAICFVRELPLGYGATIPLPPAFEKLLAFQEEKHIQVGQMIEGDRNEMARSIAHVGPCLKYGRPAHQPPEKPYRSRPSSFRSSLRTSRLAWPI